MTSDYRIQYATARLLSIPLARPAADASNLFTSQEVILCDLVDGVGNHGRGFGYTIGRGGETILEFLRSELLPNVLGRDSRWITHLDESLRQPLATVANGTLGLNAFAAIDTALWDLAGKRAGLPAHLLLGGARAEVPIYNTDVGWLSWSLEELVDKCRQATAHSPFRAVKLKVGRDATEDIERVHHVREAVGPQVQIMLDANSAWSVDQAVRVLKALAPYDITWIEEPIETRYLQDYLTLKQHISIPIAGGESQSSPAEFYEIVRQRAFDILQPDVARLGGITATMQVCGLAAAAGMKVAPHVSPELSLVVAAAIPHSLCIEYIPQMEPLFRTKLAIVDGKARASALPGLGLDFDEAALRHHEVTSYALAA